MFLSNETGGRDFPTFDIYCGPSLDPSYLCSLNSFKIVSASCHQESASSIHIYFIYSFYVQDVDFVSPPAPTSSAGDGQRGFRLEYRQIPCSTWFVKIGFVKARFHVVRDLLSLALSKSTPPSHIFYKLGSVDRQSISCGNILDKSEWDLNEDSIKNRISIVNTLFMILNSLSWPLKLYRSEYWFCNICMKYFVTMYQVIELKSSKLIAHTAGIPSIAKQAKSQPSSQHICPTLTPAERSQVDHLTTPWPWWNLRKKKGVIMSQKAWLLTIVYWLTDN